MCSLARLHGGFFRVESNALVVKSMHMFRIRKKSISSLKVMNDTQELGFKKPLQGISLCSLQSVAAGVSVPVDALAACIAGYGLPKHILQSLVEYSARSETVHGPLEICRPTSVGNMMSGRLCNTECSVIQHI